MAGLAIPPHSRRLSRLAVLALVLLSGAAFAAGLGRQLQPAGPSPFPRTTLASNQVRLAGDPPDATPAPSLQVAEAAPRHRAPAPSDTATDAPLIDVAAAPSSPAAAAAAAGADTAASAPDQPTPAADPAPPAPAPELPPT